LQLGLDVVGDQLIRIVVGPKACQATLEARQDRQVVGGGPMLGEGGGEPSEALVVVGQHQYMGRESLQGRRGPAEVPVSRRLLGVLLMLGCVLADVAMQPLLEVERGDDPRLLPPMKARALVGAADGLGRRERRGQTDLLWTSVVAGITGELSSMTRIRPCS
jgi:hypothetical protein